MTGIPLPRFRFRGVPGILRPFAEVTAGDNADPEGTHEITPSPDPAPELLPSIRDLEHEVLEPRPRPPGHDLLLHRFGNGPGDPGGGRGGPAIREYRGPQ